MFLTRRFQRQIRLHWRMLRTEAELVLWRQLIGINRVLRQARLRLEPLGVGLLILPGAFVAGILFSFLR